MDTSTKNRARCLALGREFAAQVNSNWRGFALMAGVCGSGKTRLARNILRELRDEDALFVRQEEITTALRATYGHKMEDEE